MKKNVIFFLVILSSFFACHNLFSQWTDLSTSQVLNASDTTIVQYVFSDDHKSIYVLDAKNIIRKFDIETGNLIWRKDVNEQDYGGRTINQIRLSLCGSKYLVAAKKKYDSTLVSIKDIEFDSVLFSLNIYSESTQFFVIKNDDFYYFRNDTDFYYGGGLELHRYNGFIFLYKLKNTLLKIAEFNTTYTHPNRLSIGEKSISGYFKYLNYENFKTLIKADTFSSQLLNLNFQTNKMNVLHLDIGKFNYGKYENNPIKSLTLSDNGYFTAYTLNKELKIKNNFSNKSVSSIQLPYDTTCLLFSTDNEYLFVGTGNQIVITKVDGLEPKDSIIILELFGKVENLDSYSNSKHIYFSNWNYIYRVLTDYNTNNIKAYFYYDSLIIQDGDTVKYFNASTGIPDTYVWDFGDGKTSFEVNPTHVYSNSGYFDVKLNVTKDNEKDSLIIAKAIYVVPKLKSDFRFKVTESDCLPKVEFTNTSKGAIDSVIWDFGDYTSSREGNPVHYYRFSGKYQVKLKTFCSIFHSDTSFEVSVNVHEPTIDASKFQNEKVLTLDTSAFSAQAFELHDKSIVCNFINQKNSIIKKMNSNNEQVWDQKLSGKSILKKSKRGDYVYNSANFLYFIDTDGNILKKTDFKHNVSNFYFQNDTFLLGLSDESTSFRYYYRMVDNDFNLLNEKLLYESQIYPCFSISSISYNIGIHFNKKLNYYIRYSIDCRYSTTFGDARKIESVLKINNNHYFNVDFTTIIHDFLMFTPNKMMLTDNLNTITVYDTNAAVVWSIGFDSQTQFYSLLKLNDTCFVAAGSISGKPGYMIFNESGDIIDSASLDCRYGAFNHVSVTPDTNLLFSGYKSTDANGGKVPYFVKTNSKLVQSLVMGFFLDNTFNENPDNDFTVIVPNPATEFIEITLSAKPDSEVIIYTTNGMEVYRNKYTEKIDISLLYRGMYFLRLNNKVYKFVKM